MREYGSVWIAGVIGETSRGTGLSAETSLGTELSAETSTLTVTFVALDRFGTWSEGAVRARGVNARAGGVRRVRVDRVPVRPSPSSSPSLSLAEIGM